MSDLADSESLEQDAGGKPLRTFPHPALADDGLVDALLMEIASLLHRLIDSGEEGSIDLFGLPLSPSCLSDLEARLGHGEVEAVLEAAGRSDTRETSLPGVWWTRHADQTGRPIAMLIEVAFTPLILRADIDDIRRGYARLPGLTHVAGRVRRAVA